MSIQEIQAEPAAQLAHWGHTEDDAWSIGEWAALLCHYVTRHTAGDLRAVDAAVFRHDMVKVGALALAAIEAIDRQP